MFEINQTNVHLVIPSKVCWLVDMLTEDGDMSMEEAFRLIYTSETYKKLEVEATKYWHLGPVDLCREIVAYQRG